MMIDKQWHEKNKMPTRLLVPEPHPTSQDKVVAGGRSDGGQENPSLEE